MKKCIIIIQLLLLITIASAQNLHNIPRLNSGELSPDLEGRIDTVLYYGGLRKQENFLSELYGGIVKRPGTYYIADSTDILFHEEVAEVAGDIVYGDYTRYYVAFDGASKAVVRFDADDAVDTDWGSSGYWGDANNQIAYKMLSLSDGRLLVFHYGYEDDDGNTVALAMLKADGTLDTDWGINGHYASVIPGEYNYSWGDSGGLYGHIFENDDGTFVVIASGYYHKISADGDNISAVATSTYPNRLSICYRESACWYDDDHDRIIIAGRLYAMALNPSDLSIDTDWGGLNANAGFAKIADGWYGNTYCNSIVAVSDGFLIAHGAIQNGAVITKINLGGTAVDTTWSTSGYFGGAVYYGIAGVAKFVQDSDGNLYYLDTVIGADYGKIYYLVKLDSDGIELDSVEFDSSPSANPYFRIFIFNDIIYLFTKKIEPAQNYIETWSTGLEFIDGFDTVNLAGGGGYDFVVDVLTRDSEETVAVEAVDAYWEELSTSSAVRLLSFEHSQEQAHVLEFGNKYMRIFQ